MDKRKTNGNEKGFTLIELLAVFAILGIIIAIAVPSIGNIIEDSKRSL
ncbi:type II secretion system protein [Virgibacillus byunsanensis]|uniref:Type II secretion system protein n=1 Tax=Virgibacillus byunsanensis TaxID=570945 RepID=A0ABW3LIB3_9BACI